MTILTNVRWCLTVVLICISIIISDSIFHVAVCHLYAFFGEMSIQIFCPIFDQVFFSLILSCMSCFYILEMNPLLAALFANIFSHSVGCLFVLFIVSLSVQKLLSLIRSHLFLFAFCFHYPRRQIQKTTAAIYVKGCFVYVFLEEFQNSTLTFRTLIHFQFTFVYGVTECSNFIFLHVALRFSQPHLLKILPFLYCIFLPLLLQVD